MKITAVYIVGFIWTITLLWTMHSFKFVGKFKAYNETGGTEEFKLNLEENLRLIDDKEEIRSVLCSLPQCPEGCDVCCNLPYNYNKKTIAVHHFSAQTGKWNEQQRFANLGLNKKSKVVYVGANNRGGDGGKILEMFNCTIHMYEPVPRFYEELVTHWARYKKELGYDASLHNYGMGRDNRTIFLSGEDLKGQGTFGMEGNTEKDEIPLEIRMASSVIRSVGARIDLLHVNCEGCEWEMLENLIEARSVINNIRSIQFSSHFFSQVPDLVSRYCRIKKDLAKTHNMVYGQSFGWERWDLNPQL